MAVHKFIMEDSGEDMKQDSFLNWKQLFYICKTNLTYDRAVLYVSNYIYYFIPHKDLRRSYFASINPYDQSRGDYGSV